MYDILKTMNVTRLLVSYRCPDGHGIHPSAISQQSHYCSVHPFSTTIDMGTIHLYGFAAYAALRRLRLVAKGNLGLTFSLAVLQW